MRETCYRCRKARATCYCERLAPFASDPIFAILGHPRELRNPVGTGRMLHLSLSNSLLFEGHAFGSHEGVNRLLADPALHCSLLYPGPGALDLSRATGHSARAAIPAGRRPVLFILDGTWDLARGMLNRSPNLRAMPRLGFSPERPSGYRIRVQPGAHCLSTIETAQWVLERFSDLGLSPPPPRSLLPVFEAMVDEQLRYALASGGRRTEGARAAIGVGA